MGAQLEIRERSLKRWLQLDSLGRPLVVIGEAVKRKSGKTSGLWDLPSCP